MQTDRAAVSQFLTFPDRKNHAGTLGKSYRQFRSQARFSSSGFYEDSISAIQAAAAISADADPSRISAGDALRLASPINTVIESIFIMTLPPSNSQSAWIAEQLNPATEKLLAHPVYHSLKTISSLRKFMREHVFAVWDFMSLLKRLQREFCGSSGIWVPPRDPDVARFINEIVLGEESDTNGRGGFTSHFELYLSAMEELGADSSPVRRLVSAVRENGSVEATLGELPIRPETRDFVRFNLNTAQTSTPWEVAAVFCFGREDIVPHMFQRFLPSLQQAGLGAERFEFYLQRHIELDGNEHGPLALRLLDSLLEQSSERAQQALSAAKRAIELRILLWDGIMAEVSESPEESSGEAES